MKNIKSALLLYSLIFILIFFCTYVNLADADSKLDVSVRVVDSGENVSMITGQATSPLEKISGMMSLALEEKNTKIILAIIIILIILVLAAYIIFRIKNKRKK